VTEVAARRAVGPVGAENPVTSCDLDVLVKEAAEPVSSEWPDDECGIVTAALARVHWSEARASVV
jgi:hypothetical protein